MPKSIDIYKVYGAINTLRHAQLMEDFTSLPSDTFPNAHGLRMCGNEVSWLGFGGITVKYTPEYINLLRLTAYRNLAGASYLSDAQLLHHYFNRLTPAQLLHDASLFVGSVQESGREQKTLMSYSLN